MLSATPILRSGVSRSSLIEAHLCERPDDKPVAALLERLKAAGESTEAAA